MTKIVRRANSFKRDIKRAQKRSKDLRKLFAIISQLANNTALHPRHKPHMLSGDWHQKMECHIEPDWLLIYEVDKSTVTLHRTGTHSDLFR